MDGGDGGVRVYSEGFDRFERGGRIVGKVDADENMPPWRGGYVVRHDDRPFGRADGSFRGGPDEQVLERLPPVSTDDQEIRCQTRYRRGDPLERVAQFHEELAVQPVDIA